MTPRCLRMIGLAGLLAVLVSSCASTQREPPATAYPAPPAATDLVGPVVWDPCQGAETCQDEPQPTRDGGLVLSQPAADYLAGFAEQCVARTEYQSRELDRQVQAWTQTTEAETMRADWYQAKWRETLTKFPLWIPAVLGAGVCFAAGVYLGAVVGGV